MNKEVKESLMKESDSLEPIKITDSKEQIKEKINAQAKVLKNIVTNDAFQNQLARLGYGQENLANGASYPNTRISYNYNLFNSMYRSSWIVRKIIDVFPTDMLKNWIKITSDIEPSNIKKIDKAIRTTKTKSKLKDGLKWARLYGGAVGLIIIDGEENLDVPLDYDTIMLDTYKGILIFDRWSGVNPSVELEDDINDIDFGLPKYYDIDLSSQDSYLRENNNIVRVHHSRILRFTGRDLPYWEKQYENGWGESEIEITLEELKKRDNTSYNIASLIFLANIRVLKMSDLGQLMGSSSEHAKKNLYTVLEAQNQLMSNMGLYVMDKDDDFTTEQYTFSGLSDIYETFMLDVAGACEMPVTKLFGRNPAGFNATGESDLTQYYETVEEKQEEFLLPIIDKLLPVICMSAIGAIPDDLEWEFNPCMTINNKDLADLASSMSSPIFDAFNNGLITKSVALKELKQQSDKVGMWSNITDELIQLAVEEEKQGDLSEEEQEQMVSEIQPQDTDFNSDESNSVNRINTQNQNNNSLETKIEPPEYINTNDDKYRWRDKISKFWKLGY